MGVLYYIVRGDRVADLISCSRCGIVPRGHKCPYRTYKKKAYDTEADKFRKTKRWTNKSIEVRQRDRYLCRVCEANLYNTVTLSGYINIIRLKNAVVLMQQQKQTVTDIAMECSFASIRTFYRAFRQELGCSPKEYLAN